MRTFEQLSYKEKISAMEKHAKELITLLRDGIIESDKPLKEKDIVKLVLVMAEESMYA